MPPAQGTLTSDIPGKEALAPLPDPFYNALEKLSKKFKIAIVAEGRPFPQNLGTFAPRPGIEMDPGAAGQSAEQSGKEEAPPGKENPGENEGQAGNQDEAVPPSGNLSAEEEVAAVAKRFDYTSVHQGNVYLLAKRYTNPEDIPEVTAEECRLMLYMPPGFPTRRKYSNNQLTPHIMEDEIRGIVTEFLYSYRIVTRRISTEEFTETLLRKLTSPGDFRLYQLAQDFYFLSHYDRIAATQDLVQSVREFDPVFHWQVIDKTPVFGYDGRLGAANTDFFLPVSDCDRSVVVPYGTPLPRSEYWVRAEMHLPDPDPTDPATLPRET